MPQWEDSLNNQALSPTKSPLWMSSLSKNKWIRRKAWTLSNSTTSGYPFLTSKRNTKDNDPPPQVPWSRSSTSWVPVEMGRPSSRRHFYLHSHSITRHCVHRRRFRRQADQDHRQRERTSSKGWAHSLNTRWCKHLLTRLLVNLTIYSRRVRTGYLGNRTSIIHIFELRNYLY